MKGAKHLKKFRCFFYIIYLTLEGKTTITNLLLRFYDVHKGKITLGGIDIRDIPYEELLNRISIVMQNVQLFDNTIEENIRVGKKGATKEEIIKPAKKIKSDESLPPENREKLDTGFMVVKL